MEKKTLVQTELPQKTEAKIPKDEYNVIVAQDGSGDYRSIQDAINNTPSFPYKRVVITVKNGIYHEKVTIPEWNPNVSLIGESKEQTIITYDDYFGKINLGRNSTFYTAALLVEGDGFFAENITIQNTAGKVGQAIALSVNANQVMITNCNILGNQDTLYVTGKDNKQYLKDCYVEGTVDFIFGQATVLFENCVLHSLSNAYITAASTPENVAYGFVFNNCKLTAADGVKEVYLGRPWRIYAKTVYINCDMGKHIKPEGWNDWSKPEVSKTTFYAEYNCTGEGYQPNKRVSWSYQLQKSVLKNYTIDAVLGTNSKGTVDRWYTKFNN